MKSGGAPAISNSNHYTENMSYDDQRSLRNLTSIIYIALSDKISSAPSLVSSFKGQVI
jgi:hypothetical protein